MTYNYDYIVVGAGASGLSLLVQMVNSGRFSEKRILLIEKKSKTENDRTWCFWETAPGPFESIVSSRWQRLKFITRKGDIYEEDISPYTYKLIRGIDFYSYSIEVLRQQANIDIIYAEVSAIRSTENGASVTADGKEYNSQYVFNSILFTEPQTGGGHYFLLQHFMGWFIKSHKPVFQPYIATLMDFRTAQVHGTSFFYLMPFSATEALLEYTLFSPELLDDEEYSSALQAYCLERLQLRQEDFEIKQVEKGAIPMTNFDFDESDGNVINIGTAAGQTKSSSGYTFSFIQKDCEKIVACLASGKSPATLTNRSTNNLYDSILLNILSERKMEGADIFGSLFKTNRMTAVFKFLDNETSLLEEMRIISGLPTITFSGAAIDHLFKKKSSRR